MFPFGHGILGWRPVYAPDMDLLIAHQGGWDELIFILAPAVVVGALLILANKRANEHQDRENGNGE
jgi:hypothetical protein